MSTPKNSLIANLAEIREQIDIEAVVSQHVKLFPKSNRLWGHCPFHSEKTPSFTVSVQNQFCHCFGCGFSGDAIAFQMRISNQTFPEAIEHLACFFNLKLERNDTGLWDESAYFRKEKLFLANATALEYWQQQFSPEKSGENIRLGERWFSENAINHFGVCSAPDTDVFCIEKVGLFPDNTVLIESGLIKEYKGTMRDFFRGRIIFPLRTESGKIAGFAGRIMGDNAGKTPKYLNSPENEIFKKSHLLFGLHENKAAIRASKEVIIVEGYTDVLRLWENGITNVVAICGTAMTTSNASLLKKYADKVILLLDGDEAGTKAAIKAVDILENAGLFVRIYPLPAGHDPESLLRECGKDHFHEHIQFGIRDAIIWLVEQKIRKIKDGLDQQRVVDFCRKYFSDSPHSALIDDWAEKCSALLSLDKSGILPGKNEENPGINQNIVARNNCYYYRGAKGQMRDISNFVMRPVRRIVSRKETLWLIELCNYRGNKELVLFNGGSLNSPEHFRKTIEQSGNFIFHGFMKDLNLLKAIVFADMPDCLEIAQLGWQRNHRFWTWAKGISVGAEFYPCDESGCVEINGKSYLIKAAFDSSKSEGFEQSDEQNFRYESGNIQFAEWAEMVTSAYSDQGNGHVLVLYYLASIFRDIVFENFQFFPLLFACGERGTGKSQMAWTLGKMFGIPQKQLMLDSSTEIGLARKASKFNNAVVWFDEYKNSIPSKRIQFLKGLYDGAGHVRGEYSNDTRTNEVAVKSGVFITGQELPVADPALFSRVVLMLATQTQFSGEAKAAFDQLKSAEKATGLSHITAWVSTFYPVVEEHFRAEFHRISQWLKTEAIKENPALCTEDRIVNNYAVLLAIGTLLQEHIGMSEALLDHARAALIRSMASIQNLMHGTDERAQFWDQIKFLHEDKKLNGDDLFCETTKKITLVGKDGKTQRMDFDPPKTLLFLRPSRIFPLYLIAIRQQSGKDGLPKSTLELYLKNQSSYVGYCTSKRLPSGAVSSCMVFDYEATGMRLFDYQDSPDETDE